MQYITPIFLRAKTWAWASESRRSSGSGSGTASTDYHSDVSHFFTTSDVGDLDLELEGRYHAINDTLQVERLVSPLDRLHLEWILIRDQWIKFAACGTYLLYFCMMVFRNLAFYRFEPGPRMKDLGYELIQKIPDDAWYTDVPMYFVSSFLFLLSITTLFGNGKLVQVYPNPSSVKVPLVKPYTVNMLYRYLGMLCVGHTLRFFTYVVTNPPGSADHCMPDPFHNNTLPIHKPKDLYEVFFKRLMLKPSSNCGDLMFSGHMLQIMTPVLMINKYGETVFQYRRIFHILLVIFLSKYIMIQNVFMFS
uniref:Sphingomyelin synthase-like domain-containing protein n=2 Tax=Aplanochytrium stocchinoi TaxID=215587 RepID=A0A7S3PAX3_9STRA